MRDPFKDMQDDFDRNVAAMQKRAAVWTLAMIPVWLAIFGSGVAGLAYAILWIHRHW